MPRSQAIDGFVLAYRRSGRAGGPAAVLLHGWPGDHADYRQVGPRLEQHADVVVPDLRGFGESDKHVAEPAQQYSAAAQARSVIGLIEELGLRRPVVAGYDVGSRVAQAVARAAPDRVAALVLAPPLPGAGQRVLAASAQAEFWYQPFHRLQLSTDLLDGHRAAVRAYLEHFWTHWSGPDFTPDPHELDRLSSRYGEPGAFGASIAWYRAGSGMVSTSLAERAPAPADRLAVPTSVLWPEHDPLFPLEWSDRLDEFFSAVNLRSVPGAGHFLPLEAPEVMADAILRELARTG